MSVFYLSNCKMFDSAVSIMKLVTYLISILLCNAGRGSSHFNGVSWIHAHRRRLKLICSGRRSPTVIISQNTVITQCTCSHIMNYFLTCNLFLLYCPSSFFFSFYVDSFCETFLDVAQFMFSFYMCIWNSWWSCNLVLLLLNMYITNMHG